MTHYWPLSTLKNSPLMPSAYAWKLSRFYTHPPSEPAFHACVAVARQTEPVPMQGLTIIESVNAPMRLMYTEYPNFDEWVRLERVFAAGGDNGRLFLMMEALH